MSKSKHSCSCGAGWDRSTDCHCARCHVTFAGLSTFDTHRNHDFCWPGWPFGMVEVREGVWGFGEPETQEIRDARVARGQALAASRRAVS